MGWCHIINPLANKKKWSDNTYFDKCLNKTCQNIFYNLQLAAGQTQHQAASESENPGQLDEWKDSFGLLTPPKPPALSQSS